MRIQLLTWIGATALSAAAVAQTPYVEQVIFLNEGQYDYTNQVQITPVSLGSYNVAAGTYAEFDVIAGVKFGSDVLIDGDFIYVAVDSLIVKYNKNTLTEVSSTTVEGIRKMAVWNDQLLVTIGELAPHNAYFRVFDKNTLAFIYELDTSNGPEYSSEGVVVVNDTAYVAVSNSFVVGGAKGLIGIVDLTNQTYKGEVDIAPDGLNPDNLMVSGDKLYTLNNTDWTNSSITEFNVVDREFNTTDLNAGSGCGASAFAANNIFYHRYEYDTNWTDINSTLNVFNITDKSIDTIYPSLMNVYGMANDEINSQFYITTTDYWSYGKAYMMDYTGLLTDSFDVGISAGNIALDIRGITGVNKSLGGAEFSVHPNPSSSIVYIEVEKGMDPIAIGSYDLIITDVTGREMYSERVNQLTRKSVNIENWPTGVYMLNVSSETGKSVHKIIKY
ncbi:MAG: T9SS type A sorting domain-containing protein [Flavobacteriales bacterium]|nr:T9SS type A sorting domain-containing protein [Flavobacteriales bacterium]